jgi:hypothetical protein
VQSFKISVWFCTILNLLFSCAKVRDSSEEANESGRSTCWMNRVLSAAICCRWVFSRGSIWFECRRAYSSVPFARASQLILSHARNSKQPTLYLVRAEVINSSCSVDCARHAGHVHRRDTVAGGRTKIVRISPPMFTEIRTLDSANVGMCMHSKWLDEDLKTMEWF